MKILVLNGSPSGKNSITLYTIFYLQKLFPEHSYEILHPGAQIKLMEKDFSPYIKPLEEADLIIFCYPVYTFLVPSQLHRFIELIKENNVQLKGKFATQITTSLHFYDITAHKFIENNCCDLGLNYITGLSADMEDLLSEKGRKEAKDFFRFVLWNIEHGYHEPVKLVPDFNTSLNSSVNDVLTDVVPGGVNDKTENTINKNLSDSTSDVDNGKTENTAINNLSDSIPGGADDRIEIALVTDLSNDTSGRLQQMISCFKNCMHGNVRVIDLKEFSFAGGCLGCFHCASDGTCVYKDGFDDFLRKNIQSADATVYAYTIKDHSMGYLFKLFDDRQFCNGHRTVTMGKPVGYLVDGMLENEPDLRVLMEARAQVGGNFLAGIVSTDQVYKESNNSIYVKEKICSDHLSENSSFNNTDPQIQIDQLSQRPGYTEKQNQADCSINEQIDQPDQRQEYTEKQNQADCSINEQIDQLAQTLKYAVDNDYQPPKNFYGVGGLKIFRDLIYQMRGLMKEDHRFYKQHGFYDFPQKRKGRIIGMYAVGAMMGNKKLSKKLGGKMTEGMIMPYKKVLNDDKN